MGPVVYFALVLGLSERRFHSTVMASARSLASGVDHFLVSNGAAGEVSDGDVDCHLVATKRGCRVDILEHCPGIRTA